MCNNSIISQPIALQFCTLPSSQDSKGLSGHHHVSITLLWSSHSFNSPVKSTSHSFLIGSSEPYLYPAVAKLGKNLKVLMSVTEIELYPKVEFSNGFTVDNLKMKEVQDRAHRYCFIANSLSDEVKVKIN